MVKYHAIDNREMKLYLECGADVYELSRKLRASLVNSVYIQGRGYEDFTAIYYRENNCIGHITNQIRKISLIKGTRIA